MNTEQKHEYQFGLENMNINFNYVKHVFDIF